MVGRSLAPVWGRSGQHAVQLAAMVRLMIEKVRSQLSAVYRVRSRLAGLAYQLKVSSNQPEPRLSAPVEDAGSHSEGPQGDGSPCGRSPPAKRRMQN